MIVEHQKAQLLLDFINIAKEGIVKPNDVSQAVRKLDQLKKSGIEIGGAIDCCTSSNIVRDGLEFKPYIKAATEEFFKILEIKVGE